MCMLICMLIGWFYIFVCLNGYLFAQLIMQIFKTNKLFKVFFLISWLCMFLFGFLYKDSVRITILQELLLGIDSLKATSRVQRFADQFVYKQFAY